jgi:flagellar protein FliS
LSYDAYQSYHAINLDAQTARASPVQLVLIRARAHVEAGRYEQKAHSLDKCIEIINGLSSSLDTESGGEVVANLARLYEYCAWRLYSAGFKLDTSLIDEVAGLLATLRSGWAGVQEQA